MAKEDREAAKREKLAAALRENLRRRKTEARARSTEPAKADEPADLSSEEAQKGSK